MTSSPPPARPTPRRRRCKDDLLHTSRVPPRTPSGEACSAALSGLRAHPASAERDAAPDPHPLRPHRQAVRGRRSVASARAARVGQGCLGPQAGHFPLTGARAQLRQVKRRARLAASARTPRRAAAPVDKRASRSTPTGRPPWTNRRSVACSTISLPLPYSKRQRRASPASRRRGTALAACRRLFLTAEREGSSPALPLGTESHLVPKSPGKIAICGLASGSRLSTRSR